MHGPPPALHPGLPSCDGFSDAGPHLLVPLALLGSPAHQPGLGLLPPSAPGTSLGTNFGKVRLRSSEPHSILGWGKVVALWI